MATRYAFEEMAEAGSGDAGALGLGLRREVTSVGLTALAAKTLHVAIAAPERMVDIYDNAAAGWLGDAVFPPRLRVEEPLPASPAFWRAFWAFVNLPPDDHRESFARRTLALAGELDPRINNRMAAAALAFPGVAEAASGGAPEPFDLDPLARLSPASLGYAFRQEMMRGADLGEPFGRIVPLLRHMPPPLNYINIQVIQSLPLLGLVGGYRSDGFDQVAIGGFLMGQAAHHYSALSTAVTLTIMSLHRPKSLEVMLDCIFKGWVHGRRTPLLLAAPWESLWHLPVDRVRAELGVTAFPSPLTAALRASSARPTKH
jgi:ubiquinone biosynthesis protein Coq4